MKNNAEIRELTLAELNDRINEEIFQQEKLRFNHTVSTLENPLKLRQGRRLIARLKTELRNRELNNNTGK
ncbi:MAG: 50S ribosomal protein L29 [Bacteroidia bacterium]|jgi:large subunit ribosomal protein L29|nr:50S ribosomal protein L29 [Bacteroidia bacterium]MCC6769537.1 50S ribosomal protein L29 [Bacteroidia bacterium]